MISRFLIALILTFPLRAQEYRVIESFPVAPVRACMPALTRAPNGDLLVAFSTEWEPFPAGGVLKLTISRDKGKSWSTPRILWKDEDPRVTIQVANGMQSLSNGEVLLPVTWCIMPRRKDAGPNPLQGYDSSLPGFRREVRLLRSTDSGQTWSIEDPKLEGPWFRFGRLFEAGDGRLIMSGEGWFLESKDFGHTWGPRIPVGVPYPSETIIVRAADGTWFYIHRYDGELGSRFGPRRTFMSGFSNDQGRTWSAMQKTTVQGKMPDLLVLPPGRILLAVGTEGLTDGSQVFQRQDRDSFCTLFVSDDNGHTWKRDLALRAVSPDSTVVPGDSPVMCPLEGGKILVVMQGIDRAKASDPAVTYHAGLSLIGNIIEPASHPLRVTVSEPRMIDHYEGTEKQTNFQTHHYCGLLKAGNGNLIALYGLKPDAPPPVDIPLEVYFRKSAGYRISADQGRTWNAQHELDYAANKGGTLIDGSVFVPRFMTDLVDSHQVSMRVQKTTDGGLTWTVDRDVRVRFPAGRSVQPEPRHASMYFYGNILQLDRETLVASMYGQFTDMKQFRTIVILSHDRGHSWDYLSTVAGDKPSGHGGYTEPSIVRLVNGELLCVMRTEFQKDRAMVQCRSRDGGKTWTDPIPAPGIPGVSFADRQSVNPDGLPRKFDAGNVSPMLSLLENGVLGLAYGRPGIKVALSADGTGRYWDQIVELVPKAPAYSYSTNDVTAGMPGLIAIGPDQFLVLYDIYHYAATPTAPRLNSIFVRTMTVHK